MLENQIEMDNRIDTYPLRLELYRNKFGKFFIIRKDQPEDELYPVSNKEALRLMELYSNDKIEDFFYIAEAGATARSFDKIPEVQIALRLPKFLLDKSKELAKSRGLSFNTWAIRSLENTLFLEKLDVKN